MAENSKIEWTDHTWNPWIGCTKVVRTSSTTWRQLRKWDKAAAAAGTRAFVFSLSLGDIWDNRVDPAWRREAFDRARECPNLVMLYLSKRIGNAVDMARDAGGLPPNSALGATFGDQSDYDRDAGKLYVAGKMTGALFTFGSFEPLLGPVWIDDYAPDWIIVGGESGHNARPMDLEWARSLQRQSAKLHRIFNFKQVGGRGADKGGHTLDGQTYFDRPAVERIAA